MNILSRNGNWKSYFILLVERLRNFHYNFSILGIIKQHKLKIFSNSFSWWWFCFLNIHRGQKNNVYTKMYIKRCIANKASASETNMTFIYFISIFVDFLINFVNFHFLHSSYFVYGTIELLNRRRCCCCYCHFYSFPLTREKWKWKNNLAL